MNVAIIGRPNVGKSSLFNVLTKSRDSLVHDRPGVTRDVVTKERDGIVFLDTAGLENEKGGIARESSDLALDVAKKADVILFVVDGRAGLNPMDLEWVKLVRKSKNVILIANKCESKKGTDNLHEFYKLGLGEPFPISAEHGIGINEIWSELKKQSDNSEVKTVDAKFSIAIMGVPNVGKSTLINKILGEKRVLVRDEAGTTRDVIRIRAHYLGRDIEVIDTAGLRKKTRVTDDIEILSAIKALNAMETVGAVVLVVDATKPIESQTVKIAERIYDTGKILCVALNKWDLVPGIEREDKLLSLKHQFKDAFSQIIKPVLMPISAEKGTGISNMMKRIYELWDISNMRAPTSLVNRTIEKLVSEKQPPMSRLKRPMKIKFSSQTGIHPNVITINVGGASDIPDAYTRYLRRGIAERLGWESIPVVIKYESAENPFA